MGAMMEAIVEATMKAAVVGGETGVEVDVTVAAEIKALKYFCQNCIYPTYIFYKDKIIIYCCQNNSETKVLILQLNCKENSVLKARKHFFRISLFYRHCSLQIWFTVVLTTI